MKFKVKQKAEGELPDLNKCTARTLTKAIGLSPKLASDIVAYRRKYGNFVHVRDLWDIENMTMPLFEFLVSNYTVNKQTKLRNPKSLKRVKRKTRLVKRADSKKVSKRKAKRMRKVNQSMRGRGRFDKTMITMNPVDVMQSASGNALTVVYRVVPSVKSKLKKSDKAAQATDNTLNTKNIDSANKEPSFSVRTARKSDKQNDEKEAIFGSKRGGIQTESQTEQNRKRNYDRETLVLSKHQTSDSGKIGKGPLSQGVKATAYSDGSLTVDHVRSAQADQEKPNRLKSIEKWINDVEQITKRSASRDDRKSLSDNQAGKHRASKSVTLRTESSKYGSAPGSPKVNVKTSAVKVGSRGTSRTNEKERGPIRKGNMDGIYSTGGDKGEVVRQMSGQMKNKHSKSEPIPGTSSVTFQEPVSNKIKSTGVKDDLAQQQRKQREQHQQRNDNGPIEDEGKNDGHHRSHRHRRHGEKHHSHRNRDYMNRDDRTERDKRKERSRDRYRSRDKSEDEDISCSIM